ncbi:MAG TPA: adenylate/guanylate cyclase domain-containing protein [Vampirovibrionales bacterium]
MVNSSGDRQEVSVLFSEISGYSSLTENLEASEVASLLQDYFESMLEAVNEYRQNHEQQIEVACIGNGLIVVFGAPQFLENHGWMALQTAIAMHKKLDEFNHHRQGKNQPVIQMGIGINSDWTISNNIAENKSLQFSAVGDGVNLGNLLQGVSNQYGCNIVLGENTYRACEERIWARELDRIRMRSNYPAVALYQYLGLKGEAISDESKKVMEHYDLGRQYYLSRKFAIAMGEFATVLEINSHDRAARLHLKRCQRLLKEPPNAEWDGSWVAKKSWELAEH